MKKLLAFTFVVCLLGSTRGFADFQHPGILHTEADFDRISQMVDAGTQPYLDGYNRLANSALSSSDWTPRATDTIIRGGTGDNVGLLYIDVARAYQNALLWRITGDTANGDTARDILNAWSSTLTTVTGNADRYLAAGIFGYQLANTAEIMRDYPGFDVAQMEDMLLNVFYKPLNERFLIANEFGDDHNDAHIQNYRANWDLCNMAATVAIGIFTDREDIYNIGIEYFKNGAGNGSIYNAIPFLHTDGLAQWEESGRDQAHTKMGIGLMASVAEMAWNQGDDLYGWADNRFLRAAEYVAKYNNGEDVPYTTYRSVVRTESEISDKQRSEERPVWEMIYNHYANRKGLSVPNVAARAQRLRPEGGPTSHSDHASTFDQTGFGTLLYTRPAGSGGTAELPGGNIPDGTYRFIVQLSGKAMNADGTSDGANITQWRYEGEDNQHWTLTHLGGGQYSVKNVHSGRSLDVAKMSKDHGAKFQLWNYHGGNNQKFAFLPVGEGYHRITPVHSNKPADVENTSTVDGALIHQWHYVLGGNQKWRLEPISVDARLQSHNFPDRFIRHSNSRARIDTNVSPAEDAEFKLVSGLADSSGVSFESENFPGQFLRVRSNGEVWLDSNDDTVAFADEATFRRTAGLADEQSFSYQMWTDAERYLRHRSYNLYAESGSGSLFKADATFTEVAP